MNTISRTSRRRIGLFLAAFILTALVNYLTPWLIPLRQSSAVLYSLILLAWLITAKRRILSPGMRRCYMLGALLCILLFVIRAVRYNLTLQSPALSRSCWYAYYLPCTAIPLCFFSAALFAGREENAAAPRRLTWMWLAWCGLSVLILLNDLHGMMFRIVSFSNRDFRYEYGPLYYAAALWTAFYFLTGFVILIRRCRLSRCRALWYIPVLAAVPGTALLLWYYWNGGTSPQLFGHNLYNFQEVYALLFILVMESCIQIGLILSNTDYEKIFSLSPLNALIADDSGRVRHRAVNAEIPTHAQRAAARKAPLALDDDRILHSHPIRGGAVYWIEDVTAVNAANRRIADAIEYLKDEQALLGEESRIKAERTAYETQNRLYDSISPLIRPQLAAAERLLANEDIDEAAFRDRLTLSMVLCVYAKRRVNLALLTAREQRLSVEELELSILETLEYLRLRDVTCGLNRIGPARDLAAAELLLLYDFFAAVVDAALPTLSSLFVLLRTDTPISLDLSMGTPAALPPEYWRLMQRESLGAVYTRSAEDCTAQARLRFGREADA